MTHPERTTKWRTGGEPVVYSSFETFLADDSVPSGNVEISGELPLQLRWEDRGHDVVFVTFSAAVSLDHKVVPLFTGVRVTEGLKANVLFISDPTLKISTNLALAWYAGSKQMPDLQAQVAQVISHLAGDSRIILFGSSGGGFAALQTASRLPGCRVIASNPQTNISRYHANPYGKYTRIAWGIEPETPGQLVPLPTVQDLTAVYAQKLDIEVLYLQGSQDRFHLTHHCEPFFQALHSGTAATRIVRDFGAGHAAPDKAHVRGILEAAVALPEWEAFTAKAQEILTAPPAEKKRPQSAPAPQGERVIRHRLMGERHAYPSLDDFLAETAHPSGLLEIQHGLPIHAHWQDRGADTTLVTFQGNVSPAFDYAPIFASQFTLEMPDVNVLLLSDPSLLLGRELLQGWYAGSRRQTDLRMALTDLIISLAGTSRVLLLGVGSGAYAALEQGSRIPRSAVLAMNPRMSIMDEPDGRGQTYARLAWEDQADALGTADSPLGTSCATSYRRPVPASVVLVDSTSDPEYAEKQVAPFLRGLHPRNVVEHFAVTLPGVRTAPDRACHEAWIRAILQEPDWSDLSGLSGRITGP